MPMGKMSWEADPWKPAYRTWWQHMLESFWSPEPEILATCGPEYLMYEDMQQFGAESAYRGFPRGRKGAKYAYRPGPLHSGDN